MTGLDVNARIERLSTASLRHVIEPDHELPGSVESGAVLPLELLSVAGLDLNLTPEEVATLSREELASIIQASVRFEAGLMSALTLRIATSRELADPRVTYALHEVGEETRHSRVFVRMIEQLRPTAKHPLHRPLIDRLERIGVRTVTRRSALLDVLVLAGEEITDLFQKYAAEHPETDPFVVAVNRYHRREEARHVAFARTILAEDWATTGGGERFAVRYLAPLVIRFVFQMFVHPGVYETVGLPAWRTWRAAHRTSQRVALRHEATRPALEALLEGGLLRRGRIPRPWQTLCGVDRQGAPLARLDRLSEAMER